jgi:hypothetical protein
VIVESLIAHNDLLCPKKKKKKKTIFKKITKIEDDLAMSRGILWM